MFRSLVKMSVRQALPNIRLSPVEEEFFGHINSYLAKSKRPTIVRVAGGWVRDKVLGKTSKDIDITLDDAMGQQFAEDFTSYLQEKGVPTSKVAVIQANPEQSKHLMTATVRILGQDIDFANLRSENYASDSRIPEIKFGSPEVDAQRRDLTINSLFYNVNTHTIEDFTGMGISDLVNGIIRTPIDPLKTFIDDPLRIYRTIRFAGRFNFRLDEGLTRTIVTNLLPSEANPQGMLDALQRKVSKERLQKEMLQILAPDKRPSTSVLTLYRLGLFPTLICIDDLEYLRSGVVVKDAGDRQKILSQACRKSANVFSVCSDLVEKIDDILKSTLSSTSTSAISFGSEVASPKSGGLGGGGGGGGPLTPQPPGAANNIIKLYLSCIMSGIKGLEVIDKKTRPPIELHAKVMKNVLKYENENCKWVAEMLRHVDVIRGISHSHAACYNNTSVRSDGIGMNERVEAGICIQNLKSYWLDTIILTCSIECTETLASTSDYFGIDTFTISDITIRPTIDFTDPNLAPIITRYVKMIHLWSTHWNVLQQCSTMQPLLNGDDIKTLCEGCASNHTLISKYNSLQNRWQLRYNSTNVEEVKRYLLSIRLDEVEAHTP